jgi:hypothetical protein
MSENKFNNPGFKEKSTSFSDKDSSFNGKGNVYTLDTASFLKLLQIAYNLKRAFQSKQGMSRETIEQHIPMMAMLFEYIVRKLDKNSLDVELLRFLEEFLGIKFKEKEKDKDEEKEHEEEEELSKEEKDRRFRLAMYEIYKLMNPRQLAGETALDNFINNVRTRGVGEALKYEGSEYATEFKLSELQNLESHKFAFNQELRDNGARGMSL